MNIDQINRELDLAALEDEVSGRGQDELRCYECRQPYEIRGDGTAVHSTGFWDQDSRLDTDHEPTSRRRGNCYEN